MGDPHVWKQIRAKLRCGTPLLTAASLLTAPLFLSARTAPDRGGASIPHKYTLEEHHAAAATDVGVKNNENSNPAQTKIEYGENKGSQKEANNDLSAWESPLKTTFTGDVRYTAGEGAVHPFFPKLRD